MLLARYAGVRLGRLIKMGALPTRSFASHVDQSLKGSKLSLAQGKRGEGRAKIKRPATYRGLSKVEALPYQLDPWTTMQRAKAHVEESKAITTPTTHIASCKAVYLPYWLVDANFSMKVLGEGVEEPADMKLLSFRSRMPGFDVQPFRSLPLSLPGHHGDVGAVSGDYEVFTSAHLDGPTKAMYAALSGSHELSELWQNDSPSEPKVVVPTKASVVPFAVSPLVIPDMLQECIREAMSVHVPKPQRLFNVQDVLEDGGLGWLIEQLYTLQLLPGYLEIDMLAAYPVLFPFYILKYSPQISDHGDVSPGLTIVVDAHRSSDPDVFVSTGNFKPDSHVGFKPLSNPWCHEYRTFAEEYASFGVRFNEPYFQPDIPFPESEPHIVRTNAEYLKQYRVAEADRKVKSAYDGQAFTAFGMPMEHELPHRTHRSECAVVQENLILQAQTSLEQADWSLLHATVREAAESRSRRRSKIVSRPEVKLGLGDLVAWADKRVQRYSKYAPENFDYLRAMHSVNQKALSLKFGFTALADFLGLARWHGDGSLDDYKAKAESLKPAWLKAWKKHRF